MIAKKRCKKCRGWMYEFMIQTLTLEKEGFICENCDHWEYEKSKYEGSKE